jgi:hypothetical protein
MPLVSISNAQRAPIREANFAATVLHGLPETLLPFTSRPNGDYYLVFVGRISPERFTAKRMGLHYVRIYEQLIAWTRSATVVPLRVPGQNTRSAAQISAAPRRPTSLPEPHLHLPPFVRSGG